MKKKKVFINLLISVGVIIGAAALIALYFRLTPTVSSDFTISSSRNDGFYLTAHRGLSSIAPENTAPALEEAGKAGYYAAEFDVMPTKDGVWVLIHDDTVDRTMNGSGKVSDFTYAELSEMKIIGGNGAEKYPDLRISTLEEALEICHRYSMRPMIEIKGGEPEDMQSVIDIVNASGAAEAALIIDFNSDRLKALRAIDPDVELWYLMNTLSDEMLEFAKAKNTGIAFNFGIPKNYTFIKKAKAEGITCASWTVDYLPVLDLLNAFGVDYVTTNRILP